MRDSPDAVLLYIPLMKDLGMSWSEIKQTPRMELEGILVALSEYNVLHSFDGYSGDDVSEMAKKKPEIRSQYARYMEAQRNIKERTGQRVERPSLKDLIEG